MISVSRAGAAWPIERSLEKLVARARLPGASSFDKAAHTLRLSEAHLDDEARLPLAFPASWLVNSPSTSRDFQAWLAPALRDAWVSLVAAVADGPEAWLDAGVSSRENAEALVARLGTNHGGVEGVSKALALLAPQSVPLMPPAAVAFALGEGMSGPGVFVAMMDWFSRATLANEVDLVEVARAYEAVPLDAPQVLDRLLWFESDGFKNFPALATTR